MKSFMKQLENTSLVDWIISLLLVVTIVGFAMYVCNHPDRDPAESESFFPTAHSDLEEFENSVSTNISTQLRSVSQLDAVNDNHIGCCLVYYDKCGHCEVYKPKWKEICQKANGRTVNGKQIQMFEIGNDIDENIWRTVSERHGIQGYPTILVKVGGRDAQWKEYNGSRNELDSFLLNA